MYPLPIFSFHQNEIHDILNIKHMFSALPAGGFSPTRPAGRMIMQRMTYNYREVTMNKKYVLITGLPGESGGHVLLLLPAPDIMYS